jgi:hypothetical protein
MALTASAASAWYSTVLNRATGRLNALLRMNADLTGACCRRLLVQCGQVIWIESNLDFLHLVWV